jgi:hypothetical protein
MTDWDRLYRRHRFPAEIRFPLSLRMVEDLLAVRGFIVSHQTVRLWAEKFGRHFAKDIRCRGTVNLSASGQVTSRGLRSRFLKMGDLAPHLHRGASQLALMARWNVVAGNLEEVGDRVVS